MSDGSKLSKTCEFCLRKFRVRSLNEFRTRRFCSVSCSNAPKGIVYEHPLTKICNVCKNEFDHTQFYKLKRKLVGGYSSTHLDPLCKKCRNKRSYSKHPEKSKAKATEKCEELRQFIMGMKDKPCSDCGNKYPPEVMDFDHRPGEEKLGNISSLQHFKMKKEILEKEIAKCDLVCANCHRMRTSSRKLLSQLKT